MALLKVTRSYSGREGIAVMLVVAKLEAFCVTLFSKQLLRQNSGEFAGLKLA